MLCILASCKGSTDAGVVFTVDTDTTVKNKDAIDSLLVTVDGTSRTYQVTKPLPGTFGVTTSPGTLDVSIVAMGGGEPMGRWSGEVHAKANSVVTFTATLSCQGGCGELPKDGGADNGNVDGGADTMGDKEADAEPACAIDRCDYNPLAEKPPTCDPVCQLGCEEGEICLFSDRYPAMQGFQCKTDDGTFTVTDRDANVYPARVDGMPHCAAGYATIEKVIDGKWVTRCHKWCFTDSECMTDETCKFDTTRCGTNNTYKKGKGPWAGTCERN